MLVFALFLLLGVQLAHALPVHPSLVQRGLFDSIKSGLDTVKSGLDAGVNTGTDAAKAATAGVATVAGTVGSVATGVAAAAVNNVPDNVAEPTPLNPVESVVQFFRPALFAQAAYCPSAFVANWTCGQPCSDLGNVEVLLAGGDNKLIPQFFVAHDPVANSIVVSHQGTDSDSFTSIANDLQLRQVPLNATLFPGVPAGVLVHNGFAEAQERTADQIKAAVIKGMADKNVTKLQIFGHSLGAAITMLDTLMFTLTLPPTTEISAVGFGTPRGGNPQWADLIDAKVKTLSLLTNKKDPIPIVPPTALRFSGLSREVHIIASDPASGAPTNMVSCPGRDNQKCASATSVRDAQAQDHSGPWLNQRVILSSKGCVIPPPA